MYFFKDQEKWNPPNEIVGKQGVDELEGDNILRVIDEETQWTEDLAQETHGNNGPVAHGVVRSPPVTQAVYANHHTHALPNHRVIEGVHTHQLEKMMGK